MFDDYKVKKAHDIKYSELDQIASQFFGQSDIQNFVNKYSSEEISMKLGENSRYIKEYWLREYENGNIFVLKNCSFSSALVLTEDGYELKDSNSLFFDNSLK